MELFSNGLVFIISYEYKTIIPTLDVSKCNIELFDITTISNWKKFSNNFGTDFKSVLKLIKTKKYKYIEKTNLFIKNPFMCESCVLETYPDLYECTGQQVLLFLEKTKSRLTDICIRTTPSQYLAEFYVSPETFANLSISNYEKLVEILIKNGELNTTMWCSVACWWNYISGISVQNYTELIGTDDPIEKFEFRKEEKKNELLFDNDDEWIKILNTYCCPKIFIRCNWFMMLHARAKINESVKVLNWIEENKQKVVWDEDLLSDTPTYAFNECYKYYLDICIFENELVKRGIKEGFE
jgi:hypothetical protein